MSRTAAAIARRRMTTARPRGRGRGREGARPAGRRGFSARVAMSSDSALEAPFLRPGHLAEDLHLRLEDHAELLVDAPAPLSHYLEDVRRRRAAGVLHEVGVLGV